MRRNLRKVPHFGVAVALLARAAQRDVLHQRHMVADARRLADDDACAPHVAAGLTMPGQRLCPTLLRPVISMAARASTAGHPAGLAGRARKVPLRLPKESCVRIKVSLAGRTAACARRACALRASRAAGGLNQVTPEGRGAPQAAGPHPAGAG